MSQASKKNYIIDKIKYLLELMEDTQAKNEIMKKASLFAPNYLNVQEIKDKLEKKDTVTKEELIKLNYYYREILFISELRDDEEPLTYTQYIEWKIKDILENEEEEHPIQAATYYVMYKLVDINGMSYVITDAAKYVEQIRDKHSIKRR